MASRAHGTVHVIPLEVTDPAQIAAAKDHVRSHTNALDVLINNAAIDPDDDAQRFGRIDPDVMLHTLHINTVAPLLIAQAFVDLLEASSLTDRQYLVSDGIHRSARLRRQLRLLREQSGAQHEHARAGRRPQPAGNRVRRDRSRLGQDRYGRPQRALEREESARGLLRVIEHLTRTDNGAYKRWNGHDLPW
ncbi:MAG: SDR family oxidoreductase [Chloroflexi bacterium]|nr:SDR family oxidoreductase [Chloroflexota bacterium]